MIDKPGDIKYVNVSIKIYVCVNKFSPKVLPSIPTYMYIYKSKNINAIILLLNQSLAVNAIILEQLNRSKELGVMTNSKKHGCCLKPKNELTCYLPAIGAPSKAPSPWNSRKRPKQLVSCSSPRYSTTKIERRDAKLAKKKKLHVSNLNL